MKSRGNLPDSPPDTPPALSQGFDSSLYNLIHEDDRKLILNSTLENKVTINAFVLQMCLSFHVQT